MNAKKKKKMQNGVPSSQQGTKKPGTGATNKKK